MLREEEEGMRIPRQRGVEGRVVRVLQRERMGFREGEVGEVGEMGEEMEERWREGRGLGVEREKEAEGLGSEGLGSGENITRRGDFGLGFRSVGGE